MRLLSTMLVGAMMTTTATHAGTQATGGAAPVEMCFDVAPDGSAIFPTSTIPAQNRELLAVFHLAPDEHLRDLDAAWVAVDVGSVAPPNTVVAQGSLHLEPAMDHGLFRFTLPRNLPVGRYRLDVTANKQPWHSVEFAVVDGGAPAASSLRELVPLDRGRVFTYAYTQQASGPAKITSAPPGATLAKDGSLHAVVTMSVASYDETGAHLQWRRGGVAFSDEWWRFDPKGLYVTRRVVGDETLSLDPPQTIMPWPVDGPKKWSYQSRDGKIRQEYRAWGPVAVPNPPGTNGSARGYVVLLREKSDPVEMTVERHFLPDRGLVRSITTTALGQRRVGREEMVLTSAR